MEKYEEYIVPAYIVFNDRALESMCEILPTTFDEFLNVTGVGLYKAEKYSGYFLEVIKEYIEKYEK